MTGSIFMETLRRGWRGMLYWSIGIGVLAMMQIIALPDAESLNAIVKAMESLPPAFIAMFGGSDTQLIATPEGFLAFQYFSFGILIYAVYAVLMGMNVTVNDEDNHITDMMLSLPVSRARFISERFLGYATLTTLMVGLSSLGVLIGISMTPSLIYDMGKVYASLFNQLPITLMILAFTTFVGGLVGRRSTVAIISGAFVVGSYFMFTIGQVVSADSQLSILKTFSVFNYYDVMYVIKNGLNWVATIGFILAAVVLVVTGGLIFQRRDVGV